MFSELTVFLCFTERNIVCREGKDHTEVIRSSLCIKCGARLQRCYEQQTRFYVDGHFFPGCRPVISKHLCDSMAETWNEGMVG